MKVSITCPAKSAAQSGRAKCHAWIIAPMPTPHNPDALMGWPSAENTLSTLNNRLQFATREEAVSFAQTRGWDYQITDPATRKIRPRSFIDNFRTTRPQDEERLARKS